jgi:hypothetical protein
MPTIYKEKDMHLGWFLGDFFPVAFKTPVCEVAIKRYKAGENEVSHYHRIATEVTFIVCGKVEMHGVIYSEGDIIIIPPMEKTDFRAIIDTITSVVKIPSVKGDKYIY